MKTELSTQSLQKALSLYEAEVRQEATIITLNNNGIKQSVRNSIPFSQRLNNFIL